MSSTHADPIFVSPATQISALLTKIAARMFDGLWFGDAPPDRISPEIFESWQFIRSLAHLYGTQGKVYLDPVMLGKLTDALILAHRCAHGLEPNTPVPERCACDLAEIMRSAMSAIFSIPFPKLPEDA